MKTLKHMREEIKGYVPALSKQNEHYRDIGIMLERYEQNIMQEYCENDISKNVMTEYRDLFHTLPEKLTNPIKDFFYWIKGEIYDLQALND